jgi:uncharacterized tellurite resistance protein B-like protein
MSGASTLGELSREERMLLMRFVCSFAWADARIHPDERALVERYVRKLDLDAAESAQVQAWLERPPPPETVDAALVPMRHRLLFVRAIESMIGVDGEVTPAERSRLIEVARLLHRAGGPEG